MKSKVHVLIPYTTEVACGAPSHYRTAMVRESVTCKKCRETEHFKNLPNAKKPQRSKQ